jgi:hypothetical protein
LTEKRAPAGETWEELLEELEQAVLEMARPTSIVFVTDRCRQAREAIDAYHTRLLAQGRGPAGQPATVDSASVRPSEATRQIEDLSDLIAFNDGMDDEEGEEPRVALSAISLSGSRTAHPLPFPRGEGVALSAMSCAPRDGTQILVVVRRDGPPIHLRAFLLGRACVAHYVTPEGDEGEAGWTLYPGLSGIDEAWLAGW